MNKLILVIEDNAMTRKLVRLTLEGENFTVIEASDGKSGLEAAKKQIPDLILLDLRLPDQYGHEVAETLRMLPGFENIPIIAFSGSLPSGEEQRASRSGYSGFIVKPIEPSRLLHLIRDYLNPFRGTVAGLTEGHHILIADDDPVQLKLSKLILHNLGFRVTTATNGVEALALARSSLPEAIVSDVLMPQMDGFRLCLAIKQDPRLAEIPVVLTSAYVSEKNDRNFALSIGAVDLVNRTPELRFVVEALRVGLSGKMSSKPESDSIEKFEGEYYHRVIRQLERQAAMNADLSQQCLLQAAALSVLSSASDALIENRRAEFSLPEIFSQCLDAAGLSCGALFLKEQNNVVNLETQVGFAEPAQIYLQSFFAKMESLMEWIEIGMPVSITTSALPKGFTHDFLDKASIKNALLVPLKFRQTSLGAFLLGSNSIDLSQRDWLVFARAVAAQIGQAIALSQSFEKIAVSEERYRQIVETAEEGVWLLDETGTTSFVNYKMAAMLGYSVEEMIGKNILFFVDDNEKSQAAEEFERRRAGGKSQGEVKFRHRDGSEFFAILSTSLFTGKNGKQGGILGMLTDVTARRRTEKALLQAEEQFRQAQKLEAIGRLAGGVAHDFNNLLSVIGMYAENIENGLNKQDPLRRAITQILKAQERGAELTRQLLAFSRKQMIHPQIVNLNEIIVNIETMLRRIVGEDIELITELSPEPTYIKGDRGQLEQVLMNIIINARDAIETTGKIIIRTKEMSVNGLPSPKDANLKDGPYIQLTVTDTGAGMDESTRVRIFEPFFTTKELGKGTGLGLSTVYGIVRQFDGSVTVDSAPGNGTTFSFYFTKQDKPLPSEIVKPVPRVSHKNATILFVEDEEALRTIVPSLLEKFNYKVLVASNGEEALAVLKQNAEVIHLVVTDVVMPKMGGRELVKRIKSSHPDVRVLFLSGYTEDTLIKYGVTGEDSFFLEKPFSIQTLLSKISEILG